MYQKIFILLILVLFTGNIAGYAQDSHMNFKAITINEGLSQNTVVDIVQDSLGYMWFATKDGLNRYDGSNFKIFKKSFDSPDLDGGNGGKLFIYGTDLWMITKGGKLEVLDLTTEIFSRLETIPNSKKKLPPVTSFLIDTENRTWIGTAEKGVYLLNGAGELITHYFDQAPLKERISSNNINQIFKDSYGKIWILTDRGANELTDTSIKSYFQNTNCKVIIETMIRDLFIGTANKGFYVKGRKDKNFNKLRRFEKGIPNDISVTSLFYDKNHQLWIGTYGKGLYIADNKIGDISHFLPNKRNKNSLGSKEILSIFSDNNEGIWIGTDGGGVRFFDKFFENFQILADHNVPEEISFEKIAAITTDRNGVIWFANSVNGLGSYDPAVKRFEIIRDEVFKNEIITDLVTDDAGDIWIGTQTNGTLIFDSQTRKIENLLIKNIDLPQQRFSGFTPAEKNRMWAGSPNSELVLLDKYKGVIRTYSEEGGGNGKIKAITRISDSLLAVGYEKNGVSIFNTKTCNFQQLAQEFIARNLSGIEINSLYFLNDWLWAGTEGDGILVVNLKTGRSKLFNEEDGLPNTTIYGILSENSRKVWVSSNKGLFRLTYKKHGGDIEIDKLNIYSRVNGLQSNEFNPGAYHKGEDETLFFGGNKGLNFFKGEEMPDRRIQSNVIINEATVDNIPLKHDKSISYIERIRLPYSQNSIALNYSALASISSEKINFTYQLEGYDEEWINAGTRKYTAYTNLPPGDYLFKIKLADNIIENAPVTTLGISIATPYWRDWRFILLLIVLIIATAYSIYKYRINQILELHKVKDNISADLHDDLGSRLTSIHMLSAISQAKFHQNKEVTRMLGSIDKEIYESSEALDEIVWNMRSADESLNDMIAKIRRCVSEILENHNLEYSIKTLDDFESNQLNMQKRRGLFLICKELINNIRKHADATNVNLEISIDKKMLYINVQDNGKGFFTERITHRNGITNIKRRVKEWSGKIQINSESGEGTCTEIWIPFEKKNRLINLLGWRP